MLPPRFRSHYADRHDRRRIPLSSRRSETVYACLISSIILFTYITGDFQNLVDLDICLHRGMSYPLVAPHWMPPEVARSREYSFKTDGWSLGIMIIEMLDKVPPYFHDVPAEVLRRIQVSPTPALTSPSRGSSSELHEFLMICLCVDPDERAGIKDLLKV